MLKRLRCKLFHTGYWQLVLLTKDWGILELWECSKCGEQFPLTWPSR